VKSIRACRKQQGENPRLGQGALQEIFLPRRRSHTVSGGKRKEKKKRVFKEWKREACERRQRTLVTVTLYFEDLTASSEIKVIGKKGTADQSDVLGRRGRERRQSQNRQLESLEV